ncbi:MAG: hypothetical protein DI551_03995 [Micavibrio aeruginosavorus]|uniref:Uncharacterized protein n=1 Tax=Micavibrio aeruginosavorus TaxID=349221 RepID=A0A2W5N0W2_9BACT|nr:MAG: hypothetical protein DI551_03995 [Micavibrio aeruginosavorus]
MITILLDYFGNRRDKLAAFHLADAFYAADPFTMARRDALHGLMQIGLRRPALGVDLGALEARQGRIEHDYPLSEHFSVFAGCKKRLGQIAAEDASLKALAQTRDLRGVAFQVVRDRRDMLCAERRHRELPARWRANAGSFRDMAEAHYAGQARFSLQ